MFRTLFFLAAIAPALLAAQAGCPDPQALNYDAAATQNDGSCLYPLTTIPLTQVAILPDEIFENSGLVKAGAKWWTLNDAGNNHDFYSFAPETGVLKQTIKVKNGSNVDWESITSDGFNLYLGDMGNNASGNRTDLGIYRIPILAVGTGSSQTVDQTEWQFLPFHYENQTDFTPHTNNDSIVFDCEAMIHVGGQLQLFGKNWRDRTCTHFALDQTAQLARPIETLNTDGLITDASLSPDGKVIALLGYQKDPSPHDFLWLLWDFHDGQFFNGNKRRLEIGTPVVFGQTEGIGFSSARTGYIANEGLKTSGGTTLISPKTWGFDISQFVPALSATSEVGGVAAPGFRVLPCPFAERVDFQFVGNAQSDFFRVRNGLGQVVFESKNAPAGLDTTAWAAGNYWFEAGFGGRVCSVLGLRN